jgi:FXSXX-COOH protein
MIDFPLDRRRLASWITAGRSTTAGRPGLGCDQATTEVHLMDEDLDIESSLIDLSEIDLALLPLLQDSVLAWSIRRVLQSAKNPDDAVSNFQQSI